MKKITKIIALISVFAIAAGVASAFGGNSIAEAQDDPWSLAATDLPPVKGTQAVNGAEYGWTLYQDWYLSTEGERGTADRFPGASGAPRIAIYVPDHAAADSPILYATNNSGWRTNPYPADSPPEGDAEDTTAHIGNFGGLANNQIITDTTDGVPTQGHLIAAALEEGWVVVIAGLRSRGTGAGTAVDTVSPVTVGDAKAVIRYLRHNKNIGELPAGNTDKIFMSGMSGGGALVTAVGSSGNSADYDDYLAWLGAAPGQPDDVFGVIGYSPITNLDYADVTYAWTFLETRRRLLGNFNTEDGEQGQRVNYNGAVSPATMEDAEWFAALMDDYTAGLNLKYNGADVDTDVLRDVMADLVKAGVQIRIDNSGNQYFSDDMEADLDKMAYNAALNAIDPDIEFGGADWRRAWLTDVTDAETFDLGNFLFFAAASRGPGGFQGLKTIPGFDGHFATAAGAFRDMIPGFHAVTSESDLWKIPGFYQGWSHLWERSFRRDPAVVLRYAPHSEYNSTEFYSDGAYKFADIEDATAEAWKNFLAEGHLPTLKQQGKMTSSIPYLLEGDTAKSAPNWWVSTGMLDTDHDLGTWTLLYLSLINNDGDVDQDALEFRFLWDTGHTGWKDSLDAFEWAKALAR